MKRPNILFIMADQMAAPALPVYGHPVVKAPNIQSLAENGVVFDNAYCNSPLCAPSRASMLTGQLPSRIGAYDNAADFPASVPTFLHYLRTMGYRTCLSGKMHFVGPDQLHGFEERLTTDIYPSDFGFVCDWERPDKRHSWYHNMLSVVQAGPCNRSNQLDFDDEVAFYSIRWLFDIVRDSDPRPFCMLVSFTHPHDPYTVTREYWDRYSHDEIDIPSVPSIPFAERDPHSQRLYHVCGMDQYEMTEARVRNARHAYYGTISYVDDKVGEILKALEETGLLENTIVIFTSDHGDMLGERGMWYKGTFYEWSARVPLILNAPGLFSARRVTKNVSLLDLLPTLVHIAGSDSGPDLIEAVDGQSILPLVRGNEDGWPDTVIGEYLAEGAVAPCLMIRRGRYKYIYSEPDPVQLFDLIADPKELENLSGLAEYQEVERTFRAEVMQRWDPSALRQEVMKNQRRRQLIFQAQMTGRHTPWDFQPYKDASALYMRNNMKLDDLERRARLPFEEPPEPDLQAGK